MTRNRNLKSGMIDSGTSARGWYRWMYCQTSLPLRTPTLLRSGPVRSEPNSSGVWKAKSPGAEGRPNALSSSSGRTCCVWQYAQPLAANTRRPSACTGVRSTTPGPGGTRDSSMAGITAMASTMTT